MLFTESKVNINATKKYIESINKIINFEPMNEFVMQWKVVHYMKYTHEFDRLILGYVVMNAIIDSMNRFIVVMNVVISSMDKFNWYNVRTFNNNILGTFN